MVKYGFAWKRRLVFACSYQVWCCQHTLAINTPCQYTFAVNTPCQHTLAINTPCQHTRNTLILINIPLNIPPPPSPLSPSPPHPLPLSLPPLIPVTHVGSVVFRDIHDVY